MTRIRLVLAFAALFLCFQLLLPTVRLLQDRRPATFGWHMYAGMPDRYTYELILPGTAPDSHSAAPSPGDSAAPPPGDTAATPTPRHRRLDVDPSGRIVSRRGEIDFREPLQRALCADNPEAVAVAARSTRPDRGTWVVPCP